jgi:hypothetical protein
MLWSLSVSLNSFSQGVTKKCHLSWLTNSALVYEPILGDEKSWGYQQMSTPVPEIIDPVFAKTSQNAPFLLSENELFRLVFVKTGSINSGTAVAWYT